MAIRKASVLDMNFMNRIRDYISDGKVLDGREPLQEDRHAHRTHD